jgi:gamma-carbonic anhydrase
MTKPSPIILPYRGEYAPNGVSPKISAKAFIAPGASVIGDVEIGEDSGVWFGCVVIYASEAEPISRTAQ